MTPASSAPPSTRWNTRDNLSCLPPSPSSGQASTREDACAQSASASGIPLCKRGNQGQFRQSHCFEDKSPFKPSLVAERSVSPLVRGIEGDFPSSFPPRIKVRGKLRRESTFSCHPERSEGYRRGGAHMYGQPHPEILRFALE